MIHGCRVHLLPGPITEINIPERDDPGTRRGPGGSAVSVRLGYILSGSTTYSGYFSISSGQTVKKSWSRSGNYLCYSSTGVLNYSGGTFQTPSTKC
ncbi:hypothetical protein [Streptomyces sp. KMM 9044]|uniref:hypothetical protein n=1 Tax=Streptomyces sp. KMM 9044 TaxID=2744474 RepID=UPI002151CD26|nr:hypothetical protein [Streptomyces sp. KMM 9044]WAX80072.1 hypothetical protein HUV60_022835 [Streptomyces sp. KMM 9044]